MKVELSMSAIEKELLAVSKIRKKTPGEDHQKYLTRLMKAVSKISDSDWEQLSSDAQDWNNGAAENHKAGAKLENFSDYDGPEIEEPEKEPEDAPPPKEKPRKRKTSACHTIKIFVIKKPSITVEELGKKLENAGLKVSNVTISTLRSDVRDTLRVLNELGVGEFTL